jgi:hypothetical protein
MKSQLITLPLVAAMMSLAACAVETEEPSTPDTEDELRAKGEDHWFYTGPLPTLPGADLVVSLDGHTVRVTAPMPAGLNLADLPHAKVGADGKLNLVYPIATAGAGSSDSRPGTYAFSGLKPYRPNGVATNSSGTSFVPWGGFPFLAYNRGIAFHGPITATKGDSSVWFLRRGEVSHGCNRMNGEHAVELAHVIGLPMRKIYPGNTNVPIPADVRNADVKVIKDYDTLDGKFIDVDYPTDVGVTRPAKIHGDAKVVMFGSWAATETPDGKDLPGDMKWEAGRTGDLYVFKEHAKQNWVCSAPKTTFTALAKFASTQPGGLLPKNFCEKRACYIERAKTGGNLAGCL